MPSKIKTTNIKRKNTQSRMILNITYRNQFLPKRKTRMKKKTTLPLHEDLTGEIEIKRRKTIFSFTQKVITFSKFVGRSTRKKGIAEGERDIRM